MSLWTSLFGKKGNSQEFSDNYQKEERVKHNTSNDAPAKDSCGWVTSFTAAQRKLSSTGAERQQQLAEWSGRVL